MLLLFLVSTSKDVWQEAWKVFTKKAEENINEATLELINHIKIELKNKVVEELKKSSTDGSSISLKNLNKIIKGRNNISFKPNQSLTI